MAKKFLSINILGQHQLVEVINDVTKGSELVYSNQKVDELLLALQQELESNKGYFIAKSIVSDSGSLTALDKEVYLVGTPSSGDFTGKDNNIAIKTTTGWLFVAPVNGMLVYNQFDKKKYLFDTTWKEDKQVSSHSDLTNIQGKDATSGNAYHLDDTLYAKVQGLKTDTDYVHLTGNVDETVTGNKTFANNVIITGDLTVNGTTTKIDTTELQVKDSKITLNDGLTTGLPVANVGVEALLGDNGKAVIEYNITSNKWEIGKEGAVKPVATLDDTALTSIDTTLSANQIALQINTALSGAGVQEYVADGAITANKLVYLTSDGKAKVADSSLVACADRIIGFAINTVADAGTVKITKAGKVTTTGLDVAKGIFLGTNGDVTQTLPVAGFIHSVGIVKSATEFVINIADYSILL